MALEGTWLQRLFLGITSIVSSDMAAELAADSRRWVWECRNCGHRRSVWEAGGIRYKGSGRERQLETCTQCRVTGVHRFYRAEGPGAVGLVGHGPIRKIAALIFLTLVLAGSGLAVVLLLFLLLGGFG
jgi:hypothetical protein